MTNLFKAHPGNQNIDDVLLKMVALNTFYSTNLYYPDEVAEHIVSLKIDQWLPSGKFALVEEVARVKIAKKNKEFFYISFASKYCSFHFPEVYPIYDSYVDKVLKNIGYPGFDRTKPESYRLFCESIMSFRKDYSLVASLKEIDQYLWLLGKEHFFPKTE